MGEKEEAEHAHGAVRAHLVSHEFPEFGGLMSDEMCLVRKHHMFVRSAEPL